MHTLAHSPISSDLEIMGGTLVFKNTRVPAQTLLDYINDGCSFEEFLDNFPSVKKHDAMTFLNLVRDMNDENHFG